MILPVLSVMGIQPVALPTVVLSTHTGGLGTPARLDGGAYGAAALEHYHALGLDFDCIYTGYLGGEAQVALAEKAFDLWPSAYKVVDPVMGDNGKGLRYRDPGTHQPHPAAVPVGQPDPAQLPPRRSFCCSVPRG